MAKRIFYCGDINPEHGGFFYVLDGLQYDYVSAVRITPASDAGGPDNLFWVDAITVNLRTGAKLDEILKICNQSLDGLSKSAQMHATIQCHIYAGAFDVEQNHFVQVGGRDAFFDYRGEWSDPYISTKLRAGTNIGKWVKRHFHELG